MTMQGPRQLVPGMGCIDLQPSIQCHPFNAAIKFQGVVPEVSPFASDCRSHIADKRAVRLGYLLHRSLASCL